MKRLFFALWPDESTRQRCVHVQDQLPSSGYKKVVPDNLHVTLVFLGNVDDSKVPELLTAAATVQMPVVDLVFDRLRYWKKPEVLCLTAQAPPEVLTLVAELTTLAQNLNIAVDDRSYHAHITLARKAKQAVNLPVQPIIWRAARFGLVESCSLPTGVEYRLRQMWPMVDGR